MSVAAYSSMSGGSGRIDQSARWWVLFSFTPKWRSSSAARPNAFVSEELRADGGVDEVAHDEAEIAIEDAQVVIAAVEDLDDAADRRASRRSAPGRRFASGSTMKSSSGTRDLDQADLVEVRMQRVGLGVDGDRAAAAASALDRLRRAPACVSIHFIPPRPLPPVRSRSVFSLNAARSNSGSAVRRSHARHHPRASAAAPDPRPAGRASCARRALRGDAGRRPSVRRARSMPRSTCTRTSPSASTKFSGTRSSSSLASSSSRSTRKPRLPAIIATWFFCCASISASTSTAPRARPRPPSHAARATFADEHRTRASELREELGHGVEWPGGNAPVARTGA